MSLTIPKQWLAGFGVIFLLSSAIILVVNKRQRETVLGRLRFHKRRTSGASTPPRSVSPNKKASIRDGPDYSSTLPPSRRCILPDLAKTLPSIKSDLSLDSNPSEDFIVNHALPINQTYSLDVVSPKYTPTGFSTAELKAIGDFPRYDILSGVPLPEPYENFDIAKALPRPYRPLRWKYHQTMCKLKNLVFFVSD